MNTPRIRRYGPTTSPASGTSIWDIYHNLADARDDEMMKDWKDNLNTVLIFASIFAAVLTPLVIESMKLLKEDQQETANSLLLCIYTQIRNDSASECKVRQFEVPQRAVVVNNALFLSLFFSIIAALIATLALQWGNEYAALVSTQRVDARKHALIRHFRFLGVERWGMHENLAMLPVLLHAAVLLFFGGMVVWLVDIHPIIHNVCVGSLVCAFLVCATPAIVAALDGNAPLRSPMASALRVLLHLQVFNVLRILYRLVVYVSERDLARGSTIYEVWLEKLANFLAKVVVRIVIPLLEDKAIEDPSLEPKVVTWTADHIDITRQSQRRILQILGEAIPLVTTSDLSGPWDKMFDHLYASSMDGSVVCSSSYQDTQLIRILVEIWITFRTRPTFTMPEDIYHYSLEDRRGVFALISPLEIDESISEGDMELIIRLMQFNMSPPEGLSSQSVDDISAALSDPARPTNPQIIRFTVSSLSIYLWTHPRSGLLPRLLNILARIFTTHRIHLSKRDTYRICSALYPSAVDSQCEADEGTGNPLGHPTQLGPFRRHFKPLQVIHSVLMNHFLSTATAAQEVSADEVHVHLRRLCRFLTYIPAIRHSDDEIFRRTQIILGTFPHFMEPCRYQSFAALSSIVCFGHIQDIPQVHEYLALLLSSRRKFPSLPPVWRDWCSLSEMNLCQEFDKDEMEWLSALRNDRRFTELLAAFDVLIADGCSKEQHLVMLSLIIDDLTYDPEFGGGGYYTDQRKRRLQELRDPALRLLGARAANMVYVGTIPGGDHPLWSDAAWIVAMRYWCEDYEDSEPSVDTDLLFSALVGQKSAIVSAINDASCRNQRLQDRLCIILEPTQYHGSDAYGTLLLHTALCNSSWHRTYLMAPGVMDALVRTTDHLKRIDLRVLSFLSNLIPVIEESQQLMIILRGILRALRAHDAPTNRTDMENMATTLRQMLVRPPLWLRPSRGDGEEEYDAISGYIDAILRILGAGAADAQAAILSVPLESAPWASVDD